MDATAETGRLGRLVNHSKNPNIITNVFKLTDNDHRLIFIAKKDICAGQEITFDYGERRKEALAAHPWLAL